VGGARNPDYEQTFVFTNDFAALIPKAEGQPAFSSDSDELFRVEEQQGICRVICFSPRHDLTVAQMSSAEIRYVVDTWANETETLGSKQFVSYVQVFENKGEIMGCSNPHPHCQIWASEHIPGKPAKRRDSQQVYWDRKGAQLLGDYLNKERADGARIVCENDHFTALVPFWAVWPYEVMIVARHAVADLPSLTSEARDALSDIMRRVCARYDNLFACSFPYSMGVYQQPTDGKSHPGWRLHLEYYPPLLRSASVKKFQVGYEMSADPQRDLTAEQAADKLRALSEQHYTTL